MAIKVLSKVDGVAPGDLRFELRKLKEDDEPRDGPYRAYVDSTNGLSVTNSVVHGYPFHPMYPARNTQWVVNGKDAFIEGDRISVLDFVPGGRSGFEKSHMTESVVMGVRGFIILFNAVELGEFQVNTFCGRTDTRTAMAARRMGFEIVDGSKNRDGSVKDDIVGVVGRIDEVRVHVDRLVISEAYRRLESRAGRRGIAKGTAIIELSN